MGFPWIPKEGSWKLEEKRLPVALAIRPIKWPRGHYLRESLLFYFMNVGRRSPHVYHFISFLSLFNFYFLLFSLLILFFLLLLIYIYSYYYFVCLNFVSSFLHSSFLLFLFYFIFYSFLLLFFLDFKNILLRF